MNEVNIDLQNERGQCTFKIEELTHYIDGGPEKTKERRDRDNLLLNQKEFFDGVPDECLSHKEKFESVIRTSVKFFSSVKKLQEGTSMEYFSENLTALLRGSPFREGTPLGLNFVIFMPAIISQGNEEQQSYWLDRIWKWEILGSFAQTELGHGTFIRGLETTATYDADTKEFVLHSPTLTSYKWWPGALMTKSHYVLAERVSSKKSEEEGNYVHLIYSKNRLAPWTPPFESERENSLMLTYSSSLLVGQASNYCIVAAQLYTKGKCYGVHFFMVQLRDEDTHIPLPGIKVGEIGAKMGYNGVNNGFLGLDKVRVPRNQMLMKHAQVLEDGTYVKSRNSKLNYGTMMYVRVIIVFDMVYLLSKAVTVATRYSAVRRQSQIKKGEQENQILDYVTQRHKLFIAIAAVHALRSTALMTWKTFNTINEELDAGNFDRLAELHALTCCLKAVSTADTAKHVEMCRYSCGGHGYMLSSSLPHIYGQVTAACVYEGENTVLFLQTARFLAKAWQQVDGCKLTPTTQYLKEAKRYGSDMKWENTVEHIIKGFQVVAMSKIKLCVESMQKKVESGMEFGDAWNMTSVQLVAAAEAHCRLLILTSFEEDVRRAAATMTPELGLVMRQLADLYAVYWTLEKLGDLFQFTCISTKDVRNLQAWYEDLLNKLRPNAVGLVDAFDIDDRVLQSTLGAQDGRVYERLMEEALKSPLNSEPVNYTFHKYLKPFLQGKL